MRSVSLSLAALVLALSAAACGGDKGPSTAPTSTATTSADATRESARAAETATAEAAPTSTPASSGARSDEPAPAGGGRGGALLSTILGNALNGAGGESPSAGLQEGDPAMLQYVLQEGDFPSGYASQGEFTFSAPDGISSTGAVDMAMSMAVGGDVASQDPSQAAFVMSMAMRFEDLTDLEAAFGEVDNISREEIIDAFQAGAGSGFDVTDVEILDTSGLGDGAVGISITIDMSELYEGLGGLSGGEGMPNLEALSVMTMRMYMFPRGDMAGAVMQMGFGDSLSANPVDLLALARIVDARLS